MKNFKFLRLCAVSVTMLVVASCEKMNVTDTAGPAGESRANMIVRVTSFEQTPLGAATRTEVADVCGRLAFILYDTDGKKVKHISQKLGDKDFGTAAFAVPEGRYLAVAVGHNSTGNPSMSNPEKLQFTNADGYSDTFYAADSVTVTDEASTAELALRRIVAKVRFVVDNPAVEGTSLVRFFYEGGSGAFSALTGYGTVKSKQVSLFDYAASDAYEVYTIPHADRDTLKFEVETQDASGLVLTNDTVLNVPVRVNHVTICRGYLFYGNSARTRPTSLTVSIDDAWATDEMTKNRSNP